MKKFSILAVFFIFILSSQSVFAMKYEKGEYLLPNKDKHFQNAEEFYKISGYTDVDKSQVSVHKLILAKDLPVMISQMPWESDRVMQGNIINVSGHLKHIDPNRQVYYFFSKNGNEYRGTIKSAVFDAETKKLITMGKIHN